MRSWLPTRRQNTLLAHLAAGLTLDEAAERMGMSRKQVLLMAGRIVKGLEAKDLAHAAWLWRVGRTGEGR